MANQTKFVTRRIHVINAGFEPASDSRNITFHPRDPDHAIPESFLTFVDGRQIGIVEIAVDEANLTYDASLVNDLKFLLVEHYDPDEYEFAILWGFDRSGCALLFIELGFGYWDNDRKFRFDRAAYDTIELDGAFKVELGQSIGTIKEQLLEYYFENVNWQLDDPITDDGPAEDDQPLRIAFEHEIGSFKGLCEDALVVGNADPDADIIAITIFASTDDGEAARVETDFGATKLTDFGIDLFEAILTVHDPHGWEWSYNDGPVNRKSGYSCCPEAVSIERSAPSALEKAEAMVRIKEWVERVATKYAPGDAKRLLETLA